MSCSQEVVAFYLAAKSKSSRARLQDRCSRVIPAMDSSVSRRAQLPAAAVSDLLEAAAVAAEGVLYFLEGREALRAFARKLADALRPGGYLVSTHTNCVVDDPESPGLDWDVPFGAKGIGEVLASVPALRFVKELRTPLYRVQLFRRRRNRPRLLGCFERSEPGSAVRGPEVVVTAPCEQPAPELAARFVTRCSAVTKGAPEGDTERLSILMYHRVAPAGAAATARYRLSPGAFEAQLRYLRDTGFYGIDLETWHRAVERHEPLPGRAVLLAFNDGYSDFEHHAWPLLERYGYAATVFLVAEYVGQMNRWDAALGEELPLLGWDAIRPGCKRRESASDLTRLRTRA